MKGVKHMDSWRYTIRKVNGHRRKVKVAWVNGREIVRIVGYVNETDRAAPSHRRSIHRR